MDVPSLVNLLLFIGAFGASLSLSGDDSDDSTTTDADSLYDSADYARTDRFGDEDDDVTAYEDDLAWFMEGGDDRLTGSATDDYANLGQGDDSAAMGAGNDIVEAGDGADSVNGGNGNDLALGDAGNDNIFGDLGDDSLGGEEGDDLLAGGTGADILSGGLGNDVISGFSTLGGATASMRAADGTDQLFGGEGDDTLLLGQAVLAMTFSPWTPVGVMAVTPSASQITLQAKTASFCNMPKATMPAPRCPLIPPSPCG